MTKKEALLILEHVHDKIEDSDDATSTNLAIGHLIVAIRNLSEVVKELVEEQADD